MPAMPPLAAPIAQMSSQKWWPKRSTAASRFGSGVGVVLGALDGTVQCRLAPGDDALHLLRVCTESRRTFAGVEHAQAAARTGAAVKEPTTVLKRGAHPADHAHGFGFLAGDGGGELAVLIKKQIDCLAKRHAVELH